MPDGPKPDRCPLCGEGTTDLLRLMNHLFSSHLRTDTHDWMVGGATFQRCWCGATGFSHNAYGFGVWTEHVELEGGLNAHLLAHALGVDRD